MLVGFWIDIKKKLGCEIVMADAYIASEGAVLYVLNQLELGSEIGMWSMN